MNSLMRLKSFTDCRPSPAAGKNIRIPKSRRDAGFTLIEILVAIFIFIVSLLGLVAVTTGVIHGNAFSKEMTTAVSLAQDQMEVLKRKQYTDSDLTAGVHSDTPASSYTRTWRVVENSPASGLKTVTMTVTWSSRGVSHNAQLVTLIAQK